MKENSEMKPAKSDANFKKSVMIQVKIIFKNVLSQGGCQEMLP